MNNIIIVLLVIAAVKFVVFGWLLYQVFRSDIEQYDAEHAVTSDLPVCIYCQSAWTRPLDEEQTRWEGDDLVLVSAYECEHCRLPFWHVERVSISKISV